MAKKVCHILRGITGSGKTTLANELVRDGGVIHSTDTFFMKDGTFNFVPRLIPIYHEKNFEAFRMSVRQGVSPIVLDNCNHRVEHFARYIEIARIYSYEIIVTEVPHLDPAVAAARSSHNVPVATIERMLQTWEPYNP